MKRFIISSLVFFLFTAPAYSSDNIGEINRFTGDVRVYSQGSVKGNKVLEEGVKLFVNDIVKTKRNALAHISFTDGSRAVLKERSTLEIESVQGLNVQNGKVLFNIKQRGRLRGVIVKAKSVVIGVKGTKFFVDNSLEQLNIFLKEGRLLIQAEEGEFVKYSKKEKDQFESYKDGELEIGRASCRERV